VAQYYSRTLGVVVDGGDEHAPGDAAASLTMDLRQARIHSSLAPSQEASRPTDQIVAVVLDHTLTGRGHVVYTLGLHPCSGIRRYCLAGRVPGASCDPVPSLWMSRPVRSDSRGREDGESSSMPLLAAI
jgi:hypothetical protein